MALKQTNEVKYITFDIFSNLDYINCAMSTKYGGVSSGIYESMNLSFSLKDEDENVFENYKIFTDTVGFNYDYMQRGRQIHGTNVAVIDDNLKPFSYDNIIEDVDGLITNKKDIPLVTFFADCVPIFFVDTKNKAIGVAHSGWRGTLNNICENVVNKMRDTFGTNPSDLLCGIGVSIHECCFLVDDDVFLEFNKYDKYKPFIKKLENKYSINLQEINKKNLMDLGVLEQNIEISPNCTCCEDELFFTHRKQKFERGSMAGFLQINS